MYIKIYYYGNKYVMNTINHRLVSLFSHCLKSDVTDILGIFPPPCKYHSSQIIPLFIVSVSSGTLSPVSYLGQL